MTRIDVISGFLGAGKTTLIKKLISEAYKGEKLVLIENEFGEIGIDGGFLKNAGIEVTEMNSGCICCSLVGDFGTAMKEVVDKYAPDRIIIEPSGVGKLSDVIKAIVKLADEEKSVKLGNATVVVDAGKCKMYMKNFGEFFNNQVEHAQTIILSRTQNITEEKLNSSIELLREKNDKAAIVTTPWNEITGAKIAEAMENKNSMAEELMAEMHEHHHHHEHDEHCECGCHDHHHDHDHDHDHDHEHHHHHEHDEHCECGCHDHHHDHDHDHEHHHHHHADEVFTSWGKETHKKYSEEFIKSVLEGFEDESYGIILRAKGIVQSETGEWLEFDYTPGEYEIRKGSADYTGRLCVIGSKLNEEKIDEIFA